MRKNRLMRLASVLLVLTLLTTSVIGGTFAKYVTTDKATDTARVAKWGVVVSATGSLFSDKYVNQAGGNTPVFGTAADASKITVQTNTAATEKNIVAPGTQSATGSGLKFSVSGQPEVKVSVSGKVKARDIYLKEDYTYGVMVPLGTLNEVNFTAQKASLYTKTDSTKAYAPAGAYDATASYYKLTNKQKVATSPYTPVLYKDSASATAITATALAKKIQDDLKATGTTPAVSTPDKGFDVYTIAAVEYEANTDLATNVTLKTLNDRTISWEWKIEDTTSEDDKKAANEKDTILGDMMAAANLDASATPTYHVVAVKGDAGSYADVTYATYETDGLVKVGDKVVASLKTGLEIELTVEQVD